MVTVAAEDWNRLLQRYIGPKDKGWFGTADTVLRRDSLAGSPPRRERMNDIANVNEEKWVGVPGWITGF